MVPGGVHSGKGRGVGARWVKKQRGVDPEGHTEQGGGTRAREEEWLHQGQEGKEEWSHQGQERNGGAPGQEKRSGCTRGKKVKKSGDNKGKRGMGGGGEHKSRRGVVVAPVARRKRRVGTPEE